LCDRGFYTGVCTALARAATRNDAFNGSRPGAALLYPQTI
jgi:hypothetical protein